MENKVLDKKLTNDSKDNLQICYAGFWIRGIALFIDEIIFLGI